MLENFLSVGASPRAAGGFFIFLPLPLSQPESATGTTTYVYIFSGDVSTCCDNLEVSGCALQVRTTK